MIWRTLRRRKPAIQLDEKPAIGVCQKDLAPALTAQNDQLLPERIVLGLQPRVRPEWRDQGGQNEPEKPDQPISLRDSLAPQCHEVFGTHKLPEPQILT